MSRSWMYWSLGLALLVSVTVSACGDGEKPPPAIGSDPPVTGSGGRFIGGDGDGDGDGDGGEFNLPGAPVVELVLGDGITSVFSSTIEATCAVSISDDEGSLPPDATSVKLTLFDGDMEQIASPVVGPGSTQGEYTADFPVADLDAGEYTVRCTAGDTSTPPKVGLTETTIYVDRGPLIEVITPASDAFLSAASLVNFEYRITPQPLFDGDDDAELEGTPRIVIHGSSHNLTLKPGTDDVYWLEAFDLNDDANFNDEPPLGTTLISVRAENAREVQRSLNYAVVVDGQGPTVTITSPAFLSIIGNAVTFVFQVVDDHSGVDWETLYVTLGSATIEYESGASSMWQRTGNSVSLTIQTRDYAGTVELSLNVFVKDLAGNSRSGAGSGTYRLDQYPPLISLDPPLFRARKGSAPDECSHAFDPVGSAAVDHGDDVNLHALMRAVVWDQANGDPGSALLYPSSVSPSTVELWVAPAPLGVPLVVNSDGDLANTCDTIDKEVAGAQRVQVASISKKGTPFYGDGTNDSATPALTSCEYKTPPAATHPPQLCGGYSDLHYVMPHSVAGNVPAIYAFGIGTGTNLDCNGTTFEVRSFVGQTYSGWVCAAMMAADNVGNVGVSEPIAFCLYDGGGSPPACLGQGPAGAPSCTDGCTPAKFPSGGIIVKDH